MGDWSISITFSKFSKPSIFWYFAGVCFEPLSFEAAALKSVSITKVDFPPPETPVTHINSSVGKETVTFLRLLPFAPINLISDILLFLLFCGTGILFLPER